jgi:hypothetical protein
MTEPGDGWRAHRLNQQAHGNGNHFTGGHNFAPSPYAVASVIQGVPHEEHAAYVKRSAAELHRHQNQVKMLRRLLVAICAISFAVGSIATWQIPKVFDRRPQGSALADTPIREQRRIIPISVTATGHRDDVNSDCTKEHISFAPAKLIDQDWNTGWGASDHDGAGKSITVQFKTRVHLREIGLVPGFAKIAQRWSKDKSKRCKVAAAFPLNHIVKKVSFTFDNGTSVVHQYRQEPTMQAASVDVTTRSVVITINETKLPPGADEDTIISEAEFIGQ